jgi:tRNA nucleotidyltransferase (CCA-adding enzyme)
MFWQKKLALLLGNHLPFEIDCLPPMACLVGGAVRDTLLDRQGDYLDLDFVLPELALETAKAIAQRYRAGFVILDEERQIARVVFKQGTVDFAKQEGESIEIDLQRRDFTVNAIAYNPRCEQLIDPLGGLKDLEQRILRMVSQANLQDDPLRLLRAYRQAAQLNFTIDETTRAIIHKLAPLLRKIAAERIQNELGYLLNNPKGDVWLNAAWEDGLLEPWLKYATAEKLQQLQKVETSADFLQAAVENWVVAPGAIAIVKLACLVCCDPEEAESQLVKLKYSRNEIRQIVTALTYLPQLQQNDALKSLREQYFFFLGLKDVFPTLALLATATGGDRETIVKFARRYFDERDRVAHPKPLVKGNDLIEHLKISPSPAIGKLLTELQIAYIEDKIATPDEALAYAQKLLQANFV